MRVNANPAELPSLSPAAVSVAAKTNSGSKFSELHADSLARASRATASGSVATTGVQDVTGKVSTVTKPPTDETYQAVEGKPYEEIVSGSRNGMYINRSGNARDGEAFVLVHRSGRKFHIYGTGADRVVVPVGVKPKPEASAPTTGGGTQTAPKGVEYRDVPQRAYDEIMSGPRNGMFINRSGNSRDGQAFVLVERAKHELHIYGTGRNRLVVRVVPPQLRPDITPAAPTVAESPPAMAPSAGKPTSGSSVLLR